MSAPTRYCYIDGCRNVATLVLHTYPDMTRLCDEHARFHTEYREDWEPPDEPCMGDGCDICLSENLPITSIDPATFVTVKPADEFAVERADPCASTT